MSYQPCGAQLLKAEGALMVGDAETQVWEGFFEAMEHNF